MTKTREKPKKPFWSWLTTLLSGKPHFIIGDPSRPYLLRWYLIPRNPSFNIYLHKFLRDDDDRALHDHPWNSWSLCLEGLLHEQLQDGSIREVRPGTLIKRSATFQHRVMLPCGPAWTLFITGPKIREWGFTCHDADGSERFVPWQEFVNPSNSGLVGKGCD